MKATPIVPVDFGARQIIPLSEAVSAGPLPRFRRRDHERSALVREILDQFNIEAARRFAAVPAPADDQFCESICMEGSSIQRRWVKTGAYEVRQNSATPLEVVAEPAPLAFEAVDTSLQTAASEALATMANRRPHARRGHRLPTKRLQTPRTASTGALWIAFAIAAGVVAMLARVIIHGGLI